MKYKCGRKRKDNRTHPGVKYSSKQSYLKRENSYK